MRRNQFDIIQGCKWLILILLWIYVGARAVSLAFTPDEAYSYLLMKTNYVVAMAGTANTHWVNSLGMKLLSWLLGDEEWKLRVFTVMAWPVYGISALRISSMLENRFAGLLLFCALVLNPYILDFFSLARGYGLQFAFVMAALWQAFRVLQQYRWDPASWTPVFVLAAVAVFSNYTALYFFLPLVATCFLLAVATGNGKQFWPPRTNLWWLVVAGTSLAAISNLLFIKYYTGDLYFGGDDLVYSVYETIAAGTLYVETQFSKDDMRWVPVLRTLLLTATAAGIAVAITDYLRHRKAGPLLVMAFVISFFFLQSILIHYIFQIPYLTMRTALLLFPLLMVLLFFAGEKIRAEAWWMQWAATVLKTVCLLLMVFNFYHSVNFSYCYDWKYNADTKRNFNALQREGARNALIYYSYHGVWVHYYSIAYKEKYRFLPKFYYRGELMKASQGFRDSLPLYDHAVLFPPFQLEKLRTPQVEIKPLETFLTGATIVQIQKK